MSKRTWIFWEAVAPSRPKWLHMVVCPFCRGYLLNRREIIRRLAASGKDGKR